MSEVDGSRYGMHGTGAHEAVAPSAPGTRHHAWVRRLVRIPLLGKLVLADTVLSLLAFFSVRGSDPQHADEVVIAVLLITLLLNATLVYLALLPLRELESAAARVSRGHLDARVPISPFADRDIGRIADTLNHLLNTVTIDRARVRALASQVISAGDQERAHIARELHDSTAQALGALDLLMTAALRVGHDEAAAERLRVMQEIVGGTLRDVRALSHRVHPRVLDDLGLVAALEWLARGTREQAGVETRVSSDVRTMLPLPVAAVLYRVAQEALRNAVRHGAPRSVRVSVSADAQAARLEVADDGQGFDVAAAEAARAGMGLFIMRERVALVDGELDIVSREGDGTRIGATIPLATPPGR